MTARLLLPLVFSAALLSGCGIFIKQAPREKTAEEKRIAKLISQRLDERVYRIDIDHMIPLRGGGDMLSGPYSITINGTVIDSYLPYVGVAFSVPLDDYGLTFKDDIDEYKDGGWKNGEREIVLSLTNEEGRLEYTIIVSDEGYTDVHVTCSMRDDISYRGMLDIRED